MNRGLFDKKRFAPSLWELFPSRVDLRREAKSSLKELSALRVHPFPLVSCGFFLKEKIYFRTYAPGYDTDQPVHPRSLISRSCS